MMLFKYLPCDQNHRVKLTADFCIGCSVDKVHRWNLDAKFVLKFSKWDFSII